MGVHVIATGGTIASLADPETGAVRPAVGAEELVASVPGLQEVAPIAVEEVAHVNGWNITPAIMLEVAARVMEAQARPDVDGVVVTHGTDTVEETAFLCDLTVAGPKPVAFAAAMRSGGEVSADGPRNLLDAVRLVMHPEARERGAMVVLNDEAHAARWVRKRDSFRPSAFSSYERGPIAHVTPESASFLAPAPRRVVLERPAALDRPVPVVQTYTGMEEGVIVVLLEATQAAGLVLEGTGLGNVPGSAEPCIRQATASGLPVVVATRAPSGGTASVYGGPGGGVSLQELGVIQAGRLSAAKARLLLMVLLAGGLTAGQAADRFREVVETIG
jgi:L-asparaginase